MTETSVPDTNSGSERATQHKDGGHGQHHGAHGGELPTDAVQYWEDFYRDREQVWSGKPNPLLVRETDSLTPGSALDLGCGEGADAIWLAERGWAVTGVDISSTALERAAAHAANNGVAERVRWEQHDLSKSVPEGTFDLVSAQFLHSPVDPDGRNAILRRAAEAVAVGGVLLIAGHAGWPSWVTEPPFDFPFPTNADVLEGLNLPEDAWQVQTDDLVESEMVGPEGQPAHRADAVLRIHRIG